MKKPSSVALFQVKQMPHIDTISVRAMSKHGTLGPNLLENPSFQSDDGWSVVSAWGDATSTKPPTPREAAPR